MKIKILGVLFLLSVLVCGGGIDCDSMAQAIGGAIATFIFGGALVYEGNKETITDNFKRNFNNRPYFLQK